MCVIITLKPGYILPFDMFETACFNNWHSSGVILKENNRLQVIRECPEKGNDPEKIYKILEKNKDIERFVHLRFKTEGDVELVNTHPFPAYISNKREVFFMHNGTLHEYKTPYQAKPNQHDVYQGWMAGLDDDEYDKEVVIQESDSKRFCDQRIVPLLAKLNGENGKGDIHDPLFVDVINKFWITGNKGILISNNQESLLLGRTSWETIKTDGGEFLASNNDYFKELKRGPVFEQRKAAKAKSDAKEKAKEVSPPWDGVTRLTSTTFTQTYELSEKIVDLLEDYDLYDSKGWVSLCNLTHHEIEKVYEHLDKDNMVLLFMYLTGALKEFSDELETAEAEVEKLKDKNIKATNVIATMKVQANKEKEVA